MEILPEADSGFCLKCGSCKHAVMKQIDRINAKYGRDTIKLPRKAQGKNGLSARSFPRVIRPGRRIL